MLQWIGMHFGDILVLLALGVIVVAILAGLRRNQKKGHCCGCSGCKGCASACSKEPKYGNTAGWALRASADLLPHYAVQP